MKFTDTIRYTDSDSKGKDLFTVFNSSVHSQCI